MISAAHKYDSRGFTLLEIVIAVGILGVMLSVAFTALNQISRTKRALDDERDSMLLANAILTRMTRELQLITDQANLLPPLNNPTKGYGVDVRLVGSPNRLSNGESGDQITFVANEAGQYVLHGQTHAGIVQISYRVEPDPDQPSGENRTFFLVRDEIPAIRPLKKAYSNMMTFPVTRSLVGLQLRYFDGRDWRDQWDEKQKQPPMLIQFTVKTRSPAGRISSYTTMVPVRRYKK
ncbi:MAG: prepilin-type N-terminal cleavage/methylation domain-containing protein [Deltaproteobacteria bacterium]|nr:prepilin-type N-terminal cleavage/methylation domain-containing protein [Deltaproteobacteria bacterium]